MWLTAHLICAGLSLLVALCANLSFLSILLKSRSGFARKWIRSLNAVAGIGLIALWITGLQLDGTKNSLEEVPDLLAIKLLMAAGLSFAILVVGSKLAVKVRRWPSPAVVHLGLRQTSGLVVFIGFSMTCWVMVSVLSLRAGQIPVSTLQLLQGFLLLWSTLTLTLMLFASIRALFGPGAEKNTGSVESSPGELAPSNRNSDLNSEFSTQKLATDVPVLENQAKKVSMSTATKTCLSALLGVFCISFLTNMLMLTGPMFMLQIYDRVLTSKSIPTLSALLLLVAGLFLFLGILELLRSRVLVRVGQRVDRQINKTVFQSVVGARSESASNQKSRLMQDLESLRQFFGTSAPAALFDLPWTPLYFALIFFFHWALGLLAIVGAFVLLVISLYNEMASRKPVTRAGTYAAHSAALVESGKRNSDVLHAMGMFEPYMHRWLTAHRLAVSHHLLAADVSGTMSVVSKVARLFIQSLMLAAAAYYAVAGEISAGVIVAASIILSRALAPIEQIVGQWRNIIAVRQGFRRLSDAIDNQAPEEKRINLPEPEGYISVERLYAGPLGSLEPVLKDLNFYLRPGDALAVIGSNASGKSTLSKVLVGVWPALRGNVRLDGASLSQWLPQQLGRSVGYLPQDVELFDGTVAENIARFDPNASAESVVLAAKKAHVHDLINRLPDGYATRLGDDGITISGGQRQRIALARALYGNPALLVLDEPNASLDNEGELALTAAITQLREAGCTVVIMAHRPNVLSAVNMVMVLKDGRQVSFGEKSKVLRNNVTQVNPEKLRRKDGSSKARVVTVV